MSFSHVSALALTLALALATASEAKTLVYCSEASPGGLNPALLTSTTTSDVMRQIYNRLTQFEIGTTRVIPGLAESWDISDDGKSYTFHLRKGVQFQTTRDYKPTREFNA